MELVILVSYESTANFNCSSVLTHANVMASERVSLVKCEAPVINHNWGTAVTGKSTVRF